MVVYRIEHPEHGLGPYSRHDELGSKLLHVHGYDYHNHPGALDDELILFVRQYEALFACPDMATLHAWFDGFWEELMQAGYQIEIYRVKFYKMGKSGKQLAFDPATAKKL